MRQTPHGEVIFAALLYGNCVTPHRQGRNTNTCFCKLLWGPFLFLAHARDCMLKLLFPINIFIYTMKKEESLCQ